MFRREYEPLLTNPFAPSSLGAATTLKFGDVRVYNETIYPHMNRTMFNSTHYTPNIKGMNPNYNNQSHSYIKSIEQDSFMTTKVRNMCKFADCTYSQLDEFLGATDKNNPCLQSAQPIDVVVAGVTTIELKIKQTLCQTHTDPTTGFQIKTGCGTRPYAAFGTPVFTNAVRDGQESQKAYTDRMLWGMHATIFEPVWVIYICMEVSERSERALMKTSILAMNPAKWIQT